MPIKYDLTPADHLNIVAHHVHPLTIRIYLLLATSCMIRRHVIFYWIHKHDNKFLSGLPSFKIGSMTVHRKNRQLLRDALRSAFNISWDPRHKELRLF